MVTASLEMTEAYVIEGVRRVSRSKSRPTFLSNVFNALAFAMLGALIIFFLAQGLFGVGIFSFVLFCISIRLNWFFEQMNSWVFRQTTKKSPYYCLNYIWEFTEAGIHCQSSYETAEIEWIAFTKVVQFRDGFLLFRGEKFYNWIPFSSLNDPSQAADLEVLLRSKTQNYILLDR